MLRVRKEARRLGVTLGSERGRREGHGKGVTSVFVSVAWRRREARYAPDGMDHTITRSRDRSGSFPITQGRHLRTACRLGAEIAGTTPNLCSSSSTLASATSQSLPAPPPLISMRRPTPRAIRSLDAAYAPLRTSSATNEVTAWLNMPPCEGTRQGLSGDRQMKLTCRSCGQCVHVCVFVCVCVRCVFAVVFAAHLCIICADQLGGGLEAGPSAVRWPFVGDLGAIVGEDYRDTLPAASQADSCGREVLLEGRKLARAGALREKDIPTL